MQVGICGTVQQSAAFKAAGADFLEVQVQQLTQPLLPEAEWTGLEVARTSALPIAAANGLLPASHHVTGSEVKTPELNDYLVRMMHRAERIGIQSIVFGSGAARKIPDGFSRETAKKQIIDFARNCALVAESKSVVVVAEPLNRTETNVLNSVGEAAEIVTAVGHPNFQLLVDSYHFWLENDSPLDLARLMPIIKHVHVADKDGRVFPGESGTSDYRAFFKVLKAGGYDGRISIEALSDDPVSVAARSLAFLRKEWSAA